MGASRIDNHKHVILLLWAGARANNGGDAFGWNLPMRNAEAAMTLLAQEQTGVRKRPRTPTPRETIAQVVHSGTSDSETPQQYLRLISTEHCLSPAPPLTRSKQCTDEMHRDNSRRIEHVREERVCISR